MTDTLKPCPFCGGKPELGSYGKSRNWIVVCSKCEVETKIYETEHEAVKAWNARPIEDELNDEIKHLREVLERIKEVSNYMSASETTIYDSIGIHNICCDALEGWKE